MSTKIKGHRISDKAIGKQHLTDDFNIQEGDSELTLTHPTHSNMYDLNAAQYAIMTQGGNAESLHYHPGGEGGAAGIYTHKQIDKAILEINMKLNAFALRLENSLTDYLDDFSDIDFGIPAPILESIVEIETADVITGIIPERRYEYRAVAFKGVDNTEPSSVYGITTTAETVGSGKTVELKFNVDSESTGIKIWRSKMTSPIKEILILAGSNLVPDNKVEYEVFPTTDPGNEGLMLNIPYIAYLADYASTELSSESNGAFKVGAEINKQYTDEEILEEPDGRLMYGYYNQGPQADAERVWLVFDGNPALTPTDFVLQCTTSADPDILRDEDWESVEGAVYVNDSYGVDLGPLTPAGVASENKSAFIYIEFLPKKVTGMRLIITGTLGGVKLKRFDVYSFNGTLNGRGVNHELPASMDISALKTLLVNVEALEDHNKFGLKLIDDEIVEDVVYTKNDYAYTHTNVGASENRHYRTHFYFGSFDGSKYSKMRIGFHKATSWDTELEDVSVGFTNGTNRADIDFPSTFRRVTFNGGNPRAENTLDQSTIWSDWIDISMPSSVLAYNVTFKITKGNLYGYNHGNSYTWYKDNTPGAQYDLNNDVGWVAYQNDYFYNQKLQFAENGKVLTFESIPEKNRSKTFTHYIETDLSNVDKLKAIKYMLNGTMQNGNVKFGDVKFTMAERLNSTYSADITVTSPNTLGAGDLNNLKNISLANYWQSAVVPTKLDPINLTFTFTDIKSIDRLRFGFGYDNEDYTVRDYRIQFSQDPLADENDPIDSDKWVSVSNMVFPGRDDAYSIEQAGNIIGSDVEDSNLYNELVDLKFSAVNAKAFRVLVFGTKGFSPVRISYVDFITAGIQEEYESIHEYDFDLPNTTEYTFVDDGTIGTLDDLPLVNTTASKNIFYDMRTETVSVMDKSKPGILVTKDIDAELFSRIFLVAQGTDAENINYRASNNGGDSWFDVSIETVVELGAPGAKFKLEATLNGDQKLSAYSLLYAL